MFQDTDHLCAQIRRCSRSSIILLGFASFAAVALLWLLSMQKCCMLPADLSVFIIWVSQQMIRVNAVQGVGSERKLYCPHVYILGQLLLNGLEPSRSSCMTVMMHSAGCSRLCSRPNTATLCRISNARNTQRIDCTTYRRRADGVLVVSFRLLQCC